jgi:Protein of unknown function (DUF2505)
MRFAIDQAIASPPDAVAATYADPDFYSTLVDLPNLGTPEVLSHDVDGDTVELRIRYRLVRDLSAPVRAVVDPKKLTWVEVSTHRVPDLEVTFVVEPDNYADRFKGSGSYRFDASGDGDGTVRHGTGDVSVRMPLVGRRVEQAIVAELQEHLASEVPLVERWVAEHGG